MDAGLCAECRHCQVVDAARSRFFLCRRSFDDPRYPRYPVLPVRVCLGFAARDLDAPPSVPEA